MLELLDIDIGARRTLDREVVGEHTRFAPVDAPKAADLAVRGRGQAVFGTIGDGEQARLEKGPGIKQARDALSSIEQSLCFALSEFFFAAHRERALPARVEFLQQFFKGHCRSCKPIPSAD